MKKLRKSKLARLRAKIKDESVEPLTGVVSRFPVVMPCGHWDWAYDPGTGVCAECERKGFTYPSALTAGYVLKVNIALDEALDLLSSDTSAQSIAQVNEILRSLAVSSGKIVSRLGLRKAVERYPSLIKRSPSGENREPES